MMRCFYHIIIWLPNGYKGNCIHYLPFRDVHENHTERQRQDQHRQAHLDTKSSTNWTTECLAQTVSLCHPAIRTPEASVFLSKQWCCPTLSCQGSSLLQVACVRSCAGEAGQNGGKWEQEWDSVEAGPLCIWFCWLGRSSGVSLMVERGEERKSLNQKGVCGSAPAGLHCPLAVGASHQCTCGGLQSRWKTDI